MTSNLRDRKTAGQRELSDRMMPRMTLVSRHVSGVETVNSIP